MACIQPCLRKLGVNLCYYNGKGIWPRNITERNIALNYYKNIFVEYGNLNRLILIKLLWH